MAHLKTTNNQTTEYTLELSREDLVSLIVGWDLMLPRDISSIDVSIEIPSGGDWSGKHLSIDGDRRVLMKWDVEHSSDESGETV